MWERLVEPVIGRAASAAGLEFRPSPEELLSLVRGGYSGTARTRAFRFDADALDCSEDLLDALDIRGAPGADATFLEGGHLSPVVVGLEDVSQAASAATPPGAAQTAERIRERIGERFGAGAARVGDEEE